MTTLTPINWSAFQHYKTRCPPWVKLHREQILDNPAWCRLPLASKALAPALWLLAAEYKGGAIPWVPADIAFRLRVSEAEVTEAVTPLIDNGFFTLIAPCAQEDSTVLADRLQDACPEGEGEGETEAETTDANASGAAAPVEEATATATAGKPADPRAAPAGRLMGLVRRHLYAPDGRAPADWADGRDMLILRSMLTARNTERDIGDAIEGLAILRDRGELSWLPKGQKATMRALYHTRNGILPTFTLALEACQKSREAPVVYRPPDRRPAAVQGIGELIGGLNLARPA